MPPLENASRPCPFTRRTFLRIMAAAGLTPHVLPKGISAQSPPPPRFSYPIGLPDRMPGDGLIIRHGYATENTWYNPGWWHTGEDWYLPEGDSAGVGIYAAATGEVVFAGSEYPGLVVILRHDSDLYSMYGHLDYELAVETGQSVERGQLLGTVLARTDDRAPSHLHFEMRTFLTTPAVNGNAPRYNVGCGYECPPGPGYWPIDAPEHPSVIGWRNPTQAINRRAWPEGVPEGAEAIVAATAMDSAMLWSAPADTVGAEPLDDLPLTPGDRYPLLAIETGEEDSTGTSAAAYRLWYQLTLPDGTAGWVQAAVPSNDETGSDGRPSSIRFNCLPAAVSS